MKLTYPQLSIIGAGTLLEIYDSYMFAFLMPYIEKAFFPFGGHSQIFSISAFATLFFVRPLSGIIWGLLGDSRGKGLVFRNSVLFMAIMTLIIGLLPTYAKVGVLSPILLLLLRIGQGVSISGEFSSAVVLCYEQSPPDRQIRSNGILYAFIFCGILLANLMTILISQLPSSFSFIWRIPFIFGGLCGVVVYLIRRKIKFREITYKVNLQGLAKQTKPILLSVVAAFIINLSWLYFSVIDLILTNSQITPNVIKQTSFICSLLIVISTYGFGRILEHWRLSNILSIVIILSLVIHITAIIAAVLNFRSDAVVIFYYLEAIDSGLVFATIPIVIMGLLPKEYRNSIYTVSLNISTAFIVGVLPFIINKLFDFKHNIELIWLISIIVLMASLVGIIFLRKLSMKSIPN